MAGRGERLIAAAAATLALAGCADRGPQQTSPTTTKTYQAQPTDMLNCYVNPSDSRPLINTTHDRNGLSINIFRCTINGDSSLPTKIVAVFEHTPDKPPEQVASFVAPPPSDEDDTFAIKSELTNPVTGECVLVDFQTLGYEFTKAEALPCSDSALAA